jgi:hypothetical protein
MNAFLASPCQIHWSSAVFLKLAATADLGADITSPLAIKALFSASRRKIIFKDAINHIFLSTNLK